MCTLIVVIPEDSDAPLLVGDNRDERYDRPAAPASWWTPEPGGPRIWAPRDLRAGGTWIGYSERGVFAGLTNRFGFEPDPDRRSRGEVVLEALMYGRAAQAAAAIAAWGADSINPFHLVVADFDESFLVWHDGEQILLEPLSAGVHVVTERSFGAAPSPREEYVRAQVAALASTGGLDRAALREILATRTGRGFDDVKVDVPALNYGTRSSVILELHRDVAAADTMLFAEGGF